MNSETHTQLASFHLEQLKSALRFGKSSKELAEFTGERSAVMIHASFDSTKTALQGLLSQVHKMASSNSPISTARLVWEDDSDQGPARKRLSVISWWRDHAA